MPACTLGCSVLTRPPSNSGKPVSSSTECTGTVAPWTTRSVPPLAYSVTPMPTSFRASSTTTSLSETLSRAFTAQEPPLARPSPTPPQGEGRILLGEPTHHRGQQLMLGVTDPPVQGL